MRVNRSITLVVSLAVALGLAGHASAAKRRAVRAVAPPSAPAGCHTFALVRAGLKATYLSTTPGGNVTFTITWISDTPTQTRTTQKVTTPQATADVETTIDGEVVGLLRGMKHIYTKNITPIPGVGSSTLEVDIDFVPSLLAGPAAGWCVGNTWTISPVTETITTKSSFGPPIPPQVITTIASQGEVLAVGESVTVPAGTFQTVKYRHATVSGTSVQPAITWTSMEHSIVVRQETFDTSGNLTSTTTLQHF
jgi:hypothetical protein